MLFVNVVGARGNAHAAHARTARVCGSASQPRARAVARPAAAALTRRQAENESPELLAPPPRQPRVDASDASSAKSEQQPSDLMQGDLVRPRDPSSLRTESERRRNASVKSVRSIRKPRRLKSDELNWDELDSQPLVRPFVDPATGEETVSPG